MKKLSAPLWTVILAVFLVGCGAPSLAVDTSQVKKAFAGSSGTLKHNIDQALTAIQSEDYKAVVKPLGAAVKSKKLTSQQKEALSGLIADMQKAAVQNQDKIPLNVYQALSDMVGILEGYSAITK